MSAMIDLLNLSLSSIFGIASRRGGTLHEVLFSADHNFLDKLDIYY